jgi:chorismate mutase
VSVYGRLIEETCGAIEALDARSEQVRFELEELVQLVEGRLEHEREIARRRIAAAEAILEADKERRQLERTAKQAEKRARRAMVGAEGNGVLARHILVDPGAWQVLAREARRKRTLLMTLAGQTLASEAAVLASGEVTGPPSSRRRRSPGENHPQPTNRVVRVLLTADAWNTLVDAAAATDVTSARYGGEILEAAALELGWRAR